MNERAPQDQTVCGWHAVLAAVQTRPEACRRLLFAASRLDDLRSELALLAKRRVPYRCVTDDELERVAHTRAHQGVVATFARPRDWQPSAVELSERATRPGLWLALDGVGNPHNLGAIARTAAFLGADALLVSAEAGATSTAALRTAEGALERLPLVHTTNLAHTLRHLAQSGAAVATLDVRGDVPLPSLRLPQARLRVLVAGAEETGVTAEVLAVGGQRVRIPGSRSVESLNVGAAVAIALAHLVGAA